MEIYAQHLRDHEYPARSIKYPLGNVERAIEDIDRQVKAVKGPVVLYGVSAGGTLAASLAATGQVAGAINVSGPTDLTRWTTVFPYRKNGLRIATVFRYWEDLGMDTAAKRRASPYHRLKGRQSPQLLMYGAADPLVSYDQGNEYWRKARVFQRDTILETLPDQHRHPWYAHLRALKWLDRRYK